MSTLVRTGLLIALMMAGTSGVLLPALDEDNRRSDRRRSGSRSWESTERQRWDSDRAPHSRRGWNRGSSHESSGQGELRDSSSRFRGSQTREVAEDGQYDHGPIPPSKWREYRQRKIDDRRRYRNHDTHDRYRGHDSRERYHRSHDYHDRNVPESYDYRPKSPIGPTEFGRGFVIQHDTRSHRHHDRCGHYFYDDRWHDFPRSHRHHEGCGHHFYDNTWHRWERGHRHYPGCGHHYYDGAWFDFHPLHRHGPNCGHYYYNDVWHRFSREHRHGDGCGHYYYDGLWHFWPRTHRHHSGCGHYYYNYLWYPFPPSHYGYEETVIVYGNDPDYRPEMLSRYENEAAYHVSRAYERSRSGDFYGAIAAFSTAIASTRDSGPIYLAQGLTYMQVGDFRSAYNKIMEGLQRTPDLASGHPDLRGLIPDPERVQWHDLSITQALEEHPGNHRALFVLGYLRFLTGDYEGSKSALQAVAALDPSNDQAPRLLEFIYSIESESSDGT